MSWKRALTAGLLCIIASPALAVPTLDVTGGDEMGGMRVWNVAVSPDVESPLAFELGFRTVGGNFVSVVPNPASPAPNTTPIEYLNPGNPIFGWETLSAGANNKPEGIQIGTAGDASEAFVALGSNILTVGPHDILTINTDTSVTELQWGGIYQANGTMGTPGTDFLTGLIASDVGGTATNTFGISGSLMVGGGGFIAGDYDASHAVGTGDLNLVLDNWAGTVPPVPAGWTGDQPPAGSIGVSLLNRVLDNWGNTGGSGAVLAASSSVPEPATVALIGLAVLGVAGLGRRRGK